MTSTRAPSTIPRPLALLLMAVVSLLGSALLAPAPVWAQEPRIVFFRVVPTVRNGETWHEFHWEVLGVDRVRLFSDGREMESRIQLDDGSFGWPASMAGSFRTKLNRPSRFRLVAEGPRGGHLEQSVAVDVAATQPPAPAPEIVSFSASHRFAPRNRPVELFWTTRNARVVSLFANGAKVKAPRGLPLVETAGFPVSPDKTTTYLLIAEGRDGRRASRQVKVGVVTVNHTAFCTITGRVTGGWRREIAERPGGPTSTWIVDMLLFKRGERRPTAHARVRGGRYVFDRVPVEGAYFVSPSWEGQPNRVDIRTCRAGQSHQISAIRITGGPMID